MLGIGEEQGVCLVVRRAAEKVGEDEQVALGEQLIDTRGETVAEVIDARVREAHGAHVIGSRSHHVESVKESLAEAAM